MVDRLATACDHRPIPTRQGRTALPVARYWSIAISMVLLLTISLAFTPAATAHQGDPNYESKVGDIAPGIDGLQARVLDSDDALLLQGRVREPVTVIGYQGEPMVRFLPGGTVMVNLNSPSHWQNFDRYGTRDLPRRADPEASPDWKVVSADGSHAWHDHRIHWMSESIPPAVADESSRTKVFDYQVPLRTPEGAATIQGTLWWRGNDGPPLPIIIAGAALLLALGIGTVFFYRRKGVQDPA